MSWREASTQPQNDQHHPIKIPSGLAAGPVVLNRWTCASNSSATTSQVTSSSHLIMTIFLISFRPLYSLTAHVLQGDLCVPQKCYQHPVCGATEGVSFLLTEMRQPAYGRDTTNCRPCVFWRSARVAAPFLFHSGTMTHSQSDCCFLLESFILIGESLGLVNTNTEVWGCEIIGCMLWLLETFSVFST